MCGWASALDFTEVYCKEIGQVLLNIRMLRIASEWRVQHKIRSMYNIMVLVGYIDTCIEKSPVEFTRRARSAHQ